MISYQRSKSSVLACRLWTQDSRDCSITHFCPSRKSRVFGVAVVLFACCAQLYTLVQHVEVANIKGMQTENYDQA